MLLRRTPLRTSFPVSETESTISCLRKPCHTRNRTPVARLPLNKPARPNRSTKLDCRVDGIGHNFAALLKVAPIRREMAEVWNQRRRGAHLAQPAMLVEVSAFPWDMRFYHPDLIEAFETF